MTEPVTIPATLRAAVAADLAPVRTLPPPLARALWTLPLAVLLLVAAPLVFEFRNLEPLGWTWSWGASLGQVSVGLALVGAALREAIPGRGWSRPALAALGMATIAWFITITTGSWHASPIALARGWWTIGAICLVCSTATALPAVMLASVLALRAFPMRPAIAGGLAGLGAGFMADAGWRLFCHFSQPSHVLFGHAGGVLLATLLGSAITLLGTRRSRSSRNRSYR